ncbi:MAG: YebC/PmpR family DNA-binding transcriptional regulator [Myxococcales bacterium]|nr:YebC/PmpR family DNA-binding transcriptional regulator [Myxococcales bacterium]USN50452.1 MAG: YebC/PmpR family DNA-binding transcriptional regulator [Myxococcales bacterium]
MAGHNKWSKIKHKKGAADAKRSKVWTKIIREITVASRLGGEDPSSNPRLRKAMDDARYANMPKDNIMRAISKGVGGEGGNLEELVYEGYGPAGVALVVECMTDNRNRTLSDVRTVIQKKGGNLGATGSVLFSFHKKGQLLFNKTTAAGQELSEDQLLEIGLEYGVEEISEDDDSFTLICEPEKYLVLKDAFEKAQIIPDASELTMIPDNVVHVSGENAKKLLSMVDGLEDLDDVQNVYTNMDIDEKELEELMGS